MKLLQKIQIILFIISLSMASCVSVPKEAPQLSEELGIQLQELEQSHRHIVQLFFKKEREKLSDFVQEQWLPVFAINFFNEPEIEKVWQQVVNSGNKEDRLQFLQRTAPQIQLQTQQKYQELVNPVNELEIRLLAAIQQKYAGTKTLNATITDYLYSAAKVEENRSLYLDKLGLDRADTDAILDDTEAFTRELLETAEEAQQIEERVTRFKARLNEILNNM